MGLKTTLFAMVLLFVIYWRKYMLMKIDGNKTECFEMAKKTLQSLKKSMKILKSHARSDDTIE